MGNDWKPTSALDFGSGCGTGVWAMRERWGSTISNYTAVEPSRSMTEAGHALLADFPGGSILMFFIHGQYYIHTIISGVLLTSQYELDPNLKFVLG